MKAGHGLLHRGCCKLGSCVVIWMLWRCIRVMIKGGRCRARRGFDGCMVKYDSMSEEISTRIVHSQ